LLADLVPADGVIAIMTSELWPLYSSSKAALNMLMKGYATRRPGDPRATARRTRLGAHRPGRSRGFACGWGEHPFGGWHDCGQPQKARPFGS